MSPISSILLGIIQGLTEFLPVSSSGHLVVFQNRLGLREPELLLDCSLHLGTLVAVCLYFRSDLKHIIGETWKFAMDVSRGRRRKNKISESTHASLTLWILIGTVPTLVIGAAFRTSLEGLFGSEGVVGIMLLFTGAILAITRLIPEDYGRRQEVGIFVALAVGTAQVISLIPGISRSGATIVCGLLCGLKRDLAARFSFLLSIPAIIGALVLQLHAEGLGGVGLLPLFAGFLSSVLVGLIALRILMGMVQRGRLFYFAPYCWTLGLFIIFL